MIKVSLDIGILACSKPFCHLTNKIAINKSQSYSGVEISHHLLNVPLNVLETIKKTYLKQMCLPIVPEGKAS